MSVRPPHIMCWTLASHNCLQRVKLRLLMSLLLVMSLIFSTKITVRSGCVKGVVGTSMSLPSFRGATTKSMQKSTKSGSLHWDAWAAICQGSRPFQSPPIQLFAVLRFRLCCKDLLANFDRLGMSYLSASRCISTHARLCSFDSTCEVKYVEVWFCTQHSKTNIQERSGCTSLSSNFKQGFHILFLKAGETDPNKTWPTLHQACIMHDVQALRVTTCYIKTWAMLILHLLMLALYLCCNHSVDTCLITHFWWSPHPRLIPAFTLPLSHFGAVRQLGSFCITRLPWSAQVTELPSSHKWPRSWQYHALWVDRNQMRPS